MSTNQPMVDALPDRKDHGANMCPAWGRQDPGGTHVGHMNFTIWAASGFAIPPCLKFKCHYLKKIITVIDLSK